MNEDDEIKKDFEAEEKEIDQIAPDTNDDVRGMSVVAFVFTVAAIVVLYVFYKKFF